MINSSQLGLRVVETCHISVTQPALAMVSCVNGIYSQWCFNCITSIHIKPSKIAHGIGVMELFATWFVDSTCRNFMKFHPSFRWVINSYNIELFIYYIYVTVIHVHLFNSRALNPQAPMRIPVDLEEHQADPSKNSTVHWVPKEPSLAPRMRPAIHCVIICNPKFVRQVHTWTISERVVECCWLNCNKDAWPVLVHG